MKMKIMLRPDSTVWGAARKPVGWFSNIVIVPKLSNDAIKIEAQRWRCSALNISTLHVYLQTNPVHTIIYCIARTHTHLDQIMPIILNVKAPQGNQYMTSEHWSDLDVLPMNPGRPNRFPFMSSTSFVSLTMLTRQQQHPIPLPQNSCLSHSLKEANK